MDEQPNGPDPIADGAFCYRVTCYLDGESSPDELRDLDAELQADPARRDAFVRLCLVRAALIRQGVATRAVEPFPDATGPLDDAVILPALREPDGDDPAADDGAGAGPSASAGRPAAGGPRPIGRWWVYGASVAAMVAIGFGVSWAVRQGRPAGSTAARTRPPAAEPAGPPRTPAQALPPAVVTATAGLAMDGADPLAPRTTQAAGRSIRLTAGAAELTFADGATVLVRAPAEVRVVDAGRLAVDRGAVYAHVPPPAHGFRVTAPGLDVVDRGTNFGVRAGAEAGGAEVHVFEGLVDATAVDAGGRPVASAVRVTTGEAVAHAERAAGAGPVAVPFAAVGFDRNIGDVRVAVAAHGTGVGLAGGAVDPDWQIASMPGLPEGQSRPAVVLIDPRAEYAVGTPDARWVSPTARLANAPPGRYVYRTTLDLTGFNPATASVKAAMTGDDQVVEVRVNGSVVALPPSMLEQASWRKTAEAVLDAAPWRSGPNQVEVVVDNADTGGRMNPTGLLFGWTVTAAPLVRR